MKTKLLNPARKMLRILLPKGTVVAHGEKLTGSNYLRRGRRAGSRTRNGGKRSSFWTRNIGGRGGRGSSRQKVELMLLQREWQTGRKTQKNGTRHVWEMSSVSLRLEADFERRGEISTEVSLRRLSRGSGAGNRHKSLGAAIRWLQVTPIPCPSHHTCPLSITWDPRSLRVGRCIPEHHTFQGYKLRELETQQRTGHHGLGDIYTWR